MSSILYLVHYEFVWDETLESTTKEAIKLSSTPLSVRKFVSSLHWYYEYHIDCYWLLIVNWSEKVFIQEVHQCPGIRKYKSKIKKFHKINKYQNKTEQNKTKTTQKNQQTKQNK